MYIRQNVHNTTTATYVLNRSFFTQLTKAECVRVCVCVCVCVKIRRLLYSSSVNTAADMIAAVSQNTMSKYRY